MVAGAGLDGDARGAGLGAAGFTGAADAGLGVGVVGDAGDAGTGTVLGLMGGALDTGEDAPAPGGAGAGALGLTTGGALDAGGGAAPPGAAGRGAGAGGLAPAAGAGLAAGFIDEDEWCLRWKGCSTVIEDHHRSANCRRCTTYFHLGLRAPFLVAVRSQKGNNNNYFSHPNLSLIPLTPPPLVSSPLLLLG